jgi:opacity protein-like surface antigen
MKKMLIAGATLLLASAAQLSYAKNHETPQEEVAHKAHRDWAISGYIGMAEFDTDEKPDPYNPRESRELESENAFKFGIILSKYYNDFSFNLGIEYIPEVEVESDLGHVVAEHSHIPVSLGVNYHFDTNVLDPYIGAGVGYSFNDSSESDFIRGQNMSGEDDHSFFYFLTAGVEYPVNDRYSLFLAGVYSIGDADMTAKIETPQGTLVVEDEASMDRYELNLGVKYFF